VKDLPQFQPRAREVVEAYAREVFTQDYGLKRSYLLELLSYADGHFRAIFSADYFTLAEGQSEPSKSQWNSLKKKLKRHNPAVFIFKQHGEIPGQGSGKQYYLDFGFLSER
jgi:hypothetical protein